MHQCTRASPPLPAPPPQPSSQPAAARSSSCTRASYTRRLVQNKINEAKTIMRVAGLTKKGMSQNMPASYLRCVCVRACAHARVYVCVWACVRACACVCMCARARARVEEGGLGVSRSACEGVHVHTRARTHARTRLHARAGGSTRAWPSSWTLRTAATANRCSRVQAAAGAAVTATVALRILSHVCLLWLEWCWSFILWASAPQLAFDLFKRCALT